jgi:hypothetical protein
MRGDDGVLRKPPLETCYRRLGLFPLRRGSVRFTEDPRTEEQRLPDDDAHSFRAWRTLRRARRRAVGDVIYARVSWRVPDPYHDHIRTVSERGIAVAFRRGEGSPWITDWSALLKAENLAHPKVALDPDWEELLSKDDQSFLDMMRFVHRPPRRADFGGWAQHLLGRSAVAPLVDAAWIRQVGEPEDEERWEVVIGTDRRARKAGDAKTLKEALGLAELAIGTARDELAEQLAAKGGLAAEMAAHRSSWPAPQIHEVPTTWS